MITIIRIIILIKQLQLASRFGLLWLNMSNFSTNIRPNPNQMEVKEKEEALKESTELMEMYAGNYHPLCVRYRIITFVIMQQFLHFQFDIKKLLSRLIKKDNEKKTWKIIIWKFLFWYPGKLAKAEKRLNEEVIAKQSQWSSFFWVWQHAFDGYYCEAEPKYNHNDHHSLCVWSFFSMFLMAITVQVNQEDESYIEITLPLPFSIL